MTFDRIYTTQVHVFDRSVQYRGTCEGVQLGVSR